MAFWRVRLNALAFWRGRGAEASQPPRAVAWSSMAALLEDLEVVADEYAEVLDTAVREQMWAVVDDVLIKQRAGARVPDDLGMFSADGNDKVAAVLRDHLPRLREVFAVFGLDTEQKRLHSFCNPALHSERGHHVDDFFGHS